MLVLDYKTKYLFFIMAFYVHHSLMCERTIVAVCLFHNHGGQILEQGTQRGYDVLSLELFKTHWDTALNSLIRQTCFGRGWTERHQILLPTSIVLWFWLPTRLVWYTYL